MLEGSKEDNIFHNEASLIRLAALQANQWFLCHAYAQSKISRPCRDVASKSEIRGVPAAVREVNEEVTKRPPFLRPRRDKVDVGDISTAALLTWSSLQTMPDIKSVSFPHPRLII